MSDLIPDQVKNVSIERRWAISCYIPFVNVVTCLITAVRMIESPFCLFHARQGLVLFGFWFFTNFIALVSPVLGLMLLGVIFSLYFAGIFFAWRGVNIAFPVVGQVAGRIPPHYIFTTLTGKIPQNIDNVTGAEAHDNTQNNITK